MPWRTRSPRRWAASALALGALAALTAPAGAQRIRPMSAPGPTLDALASWIVLPAPTGHEQVATDAIMRVSRGWGRDAVGNLVLRRGKGRPRRVLACAIDQAEFAVSQITDDGYLRLHELGNVRQHPLWAQFHEGQRILVLTGQGPVSGVTAVRSTHLWRRRQAETEPTSTDDLWVDIGATSADEVRARGVSLLDPVVRDWPAWTYGNLVAGPGAAARTACGAIAALAASTPANGETVYVISTQSGYRWAGLSAAISQVGDVDTLFIASPTLARTDSGAAADAVTRRVLAEPPFTAAPGLRPAATVAIGLRSFFAGTLAESVRLDDVLAYFASLAQAAGVRVAGPLAVPTIPRAELGYVPGTDSLAPVAELIGTLTTTYGASGHESAVRDVVRGALPDWARRRTTVDTAGNLLLALGPDRDTTVIVAHLDEIGFEVSGISRDGVVSLRRLGGFFLSLWEGQPALLHLESGARREVLRGVFVPRERAEAKQPSELTAWFGMDSAALAARGIAPGQWVTGYKTAARLGATRFTARSIDDRAGCTALVLAVRLLDPAKLTRKVIFQWSVREEVGLDGAAAVADALRGTVRRVHAVDTFVSSDSPLESHRFAYAPLGGGAVVRALDNSSITPAAETERVLALARESRIPMRYGVTNGGNDGSEFVRWGAVDVPVSWPLRYSHSPAEVADLRDVAALARIVAALATR